MTTKLIGLWGYAGAGKDTAAEALVADGWRREAFADRLRAMLLALDPCVPGTALDQRVSRIVDVYGWDFAKREYPEVRGLLQRLGTEAGRGVLGENVWVDALMGAWRAAGSPPTVVTDCRFPNEAEAIRAAGGITVAIIRPGCGPVNGHSSETALAAWPFDYTIANDRDVEHLHEVVRAIAPFNPRAVPNVDKANTEVQL